jgi:predicted deacylase
MYSFKSNNPGPYVLITAGVHGDEFEPMLAAHALGKEVGKMLTAGSVNILPVVNTTAFASGSRYGDDGLDLARVCPGNAFGTATEKDAAYISGLISKADYYIDMHTGGTLFEIFPLAGYMLHPSYEVLEKQRNMATAFELPLIWGTEYSPSGRSLSVARDANVPAIYVEYGGGGTLNKEVVTAYTQGCLLVMESLGMISKMEARDFIPTYWVEDDTNNSGYLQGKLPATADGIFVTGKKTGDMVAKYELLGSIINPLTGFETLLHSEEAGFLFFLRCSSHVREGDSLGGILPITKPGKVVINGN